MGECDQSNTYFLKSFKLFITCLTKNFLQVEALVSLKVATIFHCRDKPSKSNVFEAITP